MNYYMKKFSLSYLKRLGEQMELGGLEHEKI